MNKINLVFVKFEWVIELKLGFNQKYFSPFIAHNYSCEISFTKDTIIINKEKWILIKKGFQNRDSFK